MFHNRNFVLLVALVWAATCAAAEPPTGSRLAPQATFDQAAFRKFAQSHCLDCHDLGSRKAGLDLENLLEKSIASNSEAWEKVVRKLTARQMPPPEVSRPLEREYVAAVMWLETSLDAAAAASPNPGRTETFRRLNRTEYRNAIRDLLDLDVDISALLPADEASHGFDNITVADLSPTLLSRYISAAQKISRLAVGGASSPRGETTRVRPDITQDVHFEGLPLGTRGGVLIPHNFPADGEYEVQVRLMRDRNEGIEGLREPHKLEVLLDRERAHLFNVRPPADGQSVDSVDANLVCRFPVKAGPHKLGVTFLVNSSSLLETTRQPLNVHFNFYRHPRLGPAVYEVSILGPYSAKGPGDTPSRRRIFTSVPKGPDDEEACANRILATLARRAFRRPVTDEDLQPLVEFYRQGAAERGFETGIEASLSAVLANPQFLFQIQRDPHGVPAGTAYRIDGVELASRLSFFLWSSLPDDELLELAEHGELSRPDVLAGQVRRMLADERSQSLASNFAGQWLHLRNLEAATPDMRLFPDFDDNLRQAMRRETELLFASVLREDRTVLDLIRTDDTYLNERLAKHYGIPGVYGSRFRRVPVDDDSHRGGLLRQASILTVTSYATRTSPVIRGHWMLQNLVGAPPPPPPPNVPALADNTVAASLSMRERLAQHRTNAACASCHQQMDPIGFSLENYDAVGRWRKTDAGQGIDAAGSFLDGSRINGVSDLEQALLKRPELFVRTLTEKLLTFALGRGIEHYDAPAVRRIVQDASADGYRFSRLMVGIASSTPFQMRQSFPMRESP
jgi:mono/diheme cytochrome c family protein